MFTPMFITATRLDSLPPWAQTGLFVLVAVAAVIGGGWWLRPGRLYEGLERDGLDPNRCRRDDPLASDDEIAQMRRAVLAHRRARARA